MIETICGLLFIFFIFRYVILEMDRSERKKQFWDDMDNWG